MQQSGPPLLPYLATLIVSGIYIDYGCVHHLFSTITSHMHITQDESTGV